jgi:hypothetical protein
MFSIEYDDTRYRIVDEDGNEGELVGYGSPAALCLTVCLTDDDGVVENYSALLNAKPGDGDLPDGEGVVAQIIAHETDLAEVDFEEVDEDDDGDDEEEDEDEDDDDEEVN